MFSLKGIQVSKGYAIAKIVTFKHQKNKVLHEKCNILLTDEEFSLFKKAQKLVSDELLALFDMLTSSEEKEIIEAQNFMINDPEFELSVKNFIYEENYNVSWAVSETASIYAEQLRNIDSQLFKDRIMDIKDLSSRLIDVINNQKTSIVLNEEVIVYADYLTAADLLSLDRKYIKALVLSFGGITSHIAILARSMNIPCILNVPKRIIKDGLLAAVDTSLALFYIEPSEKIINIIKKKMFIQEQRQKELEKNVILDSITKDGKKIELELNFETLSSVDAALDKGFNSIGLFRTEFLLFDKKRENAEEIYAFLSEKFKDGHVTIRTYDIGGDKVVDEFFSKEANPALGLRGIRLCLEHKDLFYSQLKDILLASKYNNLHILIPMITDIDELKEVIEFFAKVKKDLKIEKYIQLGVMIETPAAALCASSIAPLVDFFSIGTNDLTQYTLVVDRENEKVSSLYKPLHPAIIRLLSLVRDAALDFDIPVSICGELSSDPNAIPLLIGLGFDIFSMNENAILDVKNVIRNIDYSECKKLADRVLQMASCTQIEKELEDFNGKIGNN